MSWEPPKVTKGFLVDTVTGESLKFQYNPNQIQLTRSPSWASQEVPGMSHPRLQFVQGGDRKFSFSLDFFSDERGRKDVKRKMDWLESLTYPDWDGITNMQRGAHPVLFNFGDLYKNITCVVTNFTATPQTLFDPTSLLPLRATVDIELTELISGKGKSYMDIRMG